MNHVMNHLRAINRKAVRVQRETEPDVVALQRTGPPLMAHFPLGCSLVFSPGWEADRTGGTAGLCQPVERDPPAAPELQHAIAEERPGRHALPRGVEGGAHDAVRARG